MLCLSSGVTVATGLKSDRITDESTLCDTSATTGLVKLGMEDRLSICNQPDTHTHIPVEVVFIPVTRTHDICQTLIWLESVAATFNFD